MVPTGSDDMAALKKDIYVSSLLHILLACLIKLVLIVLYIVCSYTVSTSSADISLHAFFSFRQF